MAIATMTSKGQLTVPVEVRTKLGLNPGDQVEFLGADHGQVTLLVRNQSIRRLQGFLGKFDRTVSIEEINESIAERAAKAGRVETDS